MKRSPKLVLTLASLFAAPFAGAAEDRPVPRIFAHGERLPGPEFIGDAGFDFIDYNGDGKLDLYMPSNSMNTGFIYLNEGSKTQPRFGNALWYPINLTETMPYGMYYVQNQTVCDLNHDGLWDLLVFDGQLRLVTNAGTRYGPNHWHLEKPAPYFPGSAKMIRENYRRTNTPESMYWNRGIFPRQVLTFAVVDWDGDGLEDLLICRFKDQTPDVKTKFTEPPARGLYFYKNVGTRQKPWFDAGIEITTPDGKSIAAPNPVAVDVDGDGVLDLVSTETRYSCNSFRVDWPTQPAVVWYRRPKKDDVAHLEPGKPLCDAAGKPIPAGVQARFADFRGVGVKDLFVQDPAKGIRWYQNSAKDAGAKLSYATPPSVLAGGDFSRYLFMFQPLVVDWFGPKSRDLIIHGETDAHCQYGLRRTSLYRNVAKDPGEIKYEFAGYLNYQGDLTMVPQRAPFETCGADVFGSFAALMPDDGSGKKRLMMSVNGKLYLFSKLAADGLTFQQRTPIEIPSEPNRTPFRSCPVLVDWNRDGKIDLVLGVLLAKGKTPLEKEYRLYLNTGTNDEPKFSGYVPLRDETGQPIKLTASKTAPVAAQCGVAVFERPDKQFDLVTEDEKDGSALRYYRNVSTDPKEPRFKFVKMLGDPAPVEFYSGNPYRYFYFGDVDGDGVPDLINFSGSLTLFRGVAPDAPAHVSDLTVVAADKEGVELRWKRPRGAVKYDLRGGDENHFSDTEWNSLRSTTGEYTVPEGAEQTARYPWPAEVSICALAVKSANGKGEFSGISNWTSAVAPPLKRVVLRNGPAGTWEEPAYNAMQACYVDAGRPKQAMAKTPSILEARTTASEYSKRQKLVLIRFKDLPKLGTLDHATLELTTDPKFRAKPQLDCMLSVDLTCSVIRDDWDAATATYVQAATNKPWAARELDTSGKFLSMAQRHCMIDPRITLRWDVTQAVRDAVKEGRTSISLLVRAEYTGPYCNSVGYVFCGPDWARVEQRPRLCIVTRE